MDIIFAFWLSLSYERVKTNVNTIGLYLGICISPGADSRNQQRYLSADQTRIRRCLWFYALKSVTIKRHIESSVTLNQEGYTACRVSDKVG